MGRLWSLVLTVTLPCYGTARVYMRRVPLLHCRPASAVLGSPYVDPEDAPVAVPDEAQQELEELLADEAGNELSAEEVAELRPVRDDREPVVTRSRARAVMSMLTRLGPGLGEVSGNVTRL